MAALPLFRAQAEAVQENEDGCLEPGLATLMTHVESTAAMLSRHASDLRSCIEVRLFVAVITSLMMTTDEEPTCMLRFC